MFLLISTCPQCGAPIFAQYDAPAGEPLLNEAGLWHAVPVPVFSCACHTAKHDDEVPRIPADDYRRARRTPGSAYDAIKPFFSPGSKEG